MRRTKEKVVLVFHSSVRSSWSEALSGIYRFARPQEWNVQVIEHEPNRKSITDLLAFWHPSGVIVEGGVDEKGVFLSGVFDRVPTVYLACDQRQLRRNALRVNHDSESIGRLAAREFLSLGLTSFAYFGFTGMFWSEERGRCFGDALRMNGRAAQGFTRRFFESGKRVAEKGFRNRFAAWLRQLPKPCGLFAANDLLAVEAVNVCHAVGIAVPDEIAILGVDNDEIACENSNPTLSSVRPNFEEAGFLSAQLLGERLDCCGRFKGEVQRNFAAAGIVRRQSTRLLPKSDVEVTKAMETIRLRACEGLKPRDVFAGFACSRRSAELRFKAIEGHSVQEAINLARLEKVKELLARADVKIDSIAGRCGWKSAAQLRVFFREVEGVSLREWRQNRGTGCRRNDSWAQNADIDLFRTHEDS